MKRREKLLGFLCAAALLFTGCAAEQEPANTSSITESMTQTEIESVAETREISGKDLALDKPFLYLGKDSKMAYYADISDPLVELCIPIREAPTDIDTIKPFVIRSYRMEEGNQNVIPSTYHGANGYFTANQTPYDGSNDKVIAEEFLKSFYGSRHFSRYALKDAAVKEAVVKPLLENHIFSLTFTADLTVEQNPAMPLLGSSWGSCDENGKISGVEVSTYLYYYDGLWGAYYDMEHYTPFLSDKMPENLSVTYQYQPVVTENGMETEQVLYEEGNDTYLTVLSVKKDRKGNEYFQTEIVRLDRLTGERAVIATIEKDYTFHRLIKRDGDMAYFDFYYCPMNSEPREGKLFMLNMKTGDMEDIMDESFVLSSDDRAIYFVSYKGYHYETKEPGEGGIYEYLTEEKTLRRISELPSVPYSISYYGITLMRKTGENLYVEWPSEMDDLSQNIYQIHIYNGVITKIR